MRRNKEPPLLVSQAEAVRLTSSAIEAFSREIPSDEEQVDALLAESIDGYYAQAFTVVSLAALHRGIL